MIACIKLLVLFTICLASFLHSGGSIWVWGSSVVELLFLYLNSLWLISKRKHLGYVIHVLLCLTFSIQCLIYYFSGEFLSVLMVDNIALLDNLGSNLVLYLICAVLAFIVALIPVSVPGLLNLYLKRCALLSLVFYSFTLSMPLFGGCLMDSPLASVFKTSADIFKRHRFLHGQLVNIQEVNDYFRRDSIEVGFMAHDTIQPRPNVIIIFTEGMSAEVLDVYNKLGLGLTPNLDSLQAVSLSFDHYFNHTAATFRGIRGQLYSGFQYLGGYGGKDHKGFAEIDEDHIKSMTKVKINSLVDILRYKGYYTYYINPEPEHAATVNYIRSLGFDQIRPLSGNRKLTDKESFQELERCISEAKEPYFISFYNIGTHHGFDSPDVKYGDGNNAVLNRFHNYDAQFGKWFAQMKKEGRFDNTLLVFTTDRASYHSPEWKESFQSHQDCFIAPIPLFFYGAGIQYQRRDAAGRNSLDLAPTLLDILGVSDCTNWFLGSSLFAKASLYDRYSAIGEDFFTTLNNSVKPIREQSDTVITEIKKYYFISVNE